MMAIEDSEKIGYTVVFIFVFLVCLFVYKLINIFLEEVVYVFYKRYVFKLRGGISKTYTIKEKEYVRDKLNTLLGYGHLTVNDKSYRYRNETETGLKYIVNESDKQILLSVLEYELVFEYVSSHKKPRHVDSMHLADKVFELESDIKGYHELVRELNTKHVVG